MSSTNPHRRTPQDLEFAPKVSALYELAVSHGSKTELWSSRLGVILAVAGNAIGLGNFLRFPGLAAQYGSGAFMIAYFISLLLLGIPIGWAEWTLGRYGGQRGYRSSPGIFHAIIRHPAGKYIGAIGVVIPLVVYMYYIFIEAWCVGYTWYFLTGQLSLGNDVGAYTRFWENFVGAHQNGLRLHPGEHPVVIFFVIVFVLNLFLLYRGLSRGIEWFCKWAIPSLIILGIIVLVRVLTLGTPDPSKPEQNVVNALGFMWNPEKVVLQQRVAAPGPQSREEWRDVQEVFGAAAIAAKRTEIAGNADFRLERRTVWKQLRNPQLWLAAAGQIFFTLGVGFGIIITYASYLRRQDDVVLSGLTASSANEFCEVGLGGMITIPAAFIFLGSAGLAGFVASSFGLGFKVMPLVFATMPLSALFGSIWFFLLFLAAITSSLAMLLPAKVFLDEALGLDRKRSIGLLALLTTAGSLFVVYFSKDLKALNTLDFWVGTFCLFMMATIIIVVFGWVVGIEKGFAEAHQGAEIRVPAIFKPIIKYLSPLYLLGIFALWLLFDLFGWNLKTGEFKLTGNALDIVGSPEHPADPVARLSLLFVAVITALVLWLVRCGARRWAKSPPHPVHHDQE